jgi:hypothetical protein
MHALLSRHKASRFLLFTGKIFKTVGFEEQSFLINEDEEYVVVVLASSGECYKVDV